MRSAAAALAHAYLTSAPQDAMAAEDYEWQMRPLGLGEMQATGLPPGDDIDPSQSNDRPVVVSYGDGERTPIQVWDGVHRILSSIMVGKGERMAAVGVKKEGSVFFEDLPDDMSELLSCLFEDAHLKTPPSVPTRAVRVDRFPDVGLATVSDDRGLAHVAQMAGQYLPPVVLNGDVWMDGRHRIRHLKDAGVEWVLAIDLAGKMPAPQPGQNLHLGLLKPILNGNSMTQKTVFTQNDLNLIRFFLPEKLGNSVLTAIKENGLESNVDNEVECASEKKAAALEVVKQMTKAKGRKAP